MTNYVRFFLSLKKNIESESDSFQREIKYYQEAEPQVSCVCFISHNFKLCYNTQNLQ